MKTLASLFIALLLAGCGAGSSAVPQRVSSAQVQRATGSGALLYATLYRTVNVFNYPQGSFVETFPLPDNAYSGGQLCSDHDGNVFIPGTAGFGYGTAGYVFEYAHGGTIPIATISEGPYEAVSCAIDPSTGNLEVTNYYLSGDYVYNVAVYPGGHGPPTFYTDPSLNYYGPGTYDDHGNFFLLGGFVRQYFIAELPAGGSTFINLTLTNGSLKHPRWIQWYGKYLAVQVSPTRVKQLQISGENATFIGITHLRGLGRHQGYPFVIQDGQFVMSILRDKSKQEQTMGIFTYPQGGEPQAEFSIGAHPISTFAISRPTSGQRVHTP